MQLERRTIAILLLAAVLTCGIFTVDVLLPRGIVISTAYMAVVLLGLFLPDRRFILLFAAICSILTVADVFFSSGSQEVWKIVVNLGLSIVMFWLTAGLYYFRHVGGEGAPEDSKPSRAEPVAEKFEAELTAQPANAIDRFITAVLATGLMSLEEIQAFLAGLPPGEWTNDAQEFARQFIRHAKLTRYQAVLIYHGRADELQFGNYVLLDKIGEGGMGQVFTAQHRRMERVVALKVLAKKIADSPEAIKRFHREVKAAAKLKHHHIVTAYDAGERHGVPFLVMEYVEGCDLARLVRLLDRPLSIGEALELVLQTARGLEYAHGSGVIHRDIKPSNLLVDHSGAVTILDMGLAKVASSLGIEGDSVIRRDGAVIGTLEYMSPEQLFDPERTGPRSDIYSLGCSLYYLLTGCPPFEGSGDTAKLLARREQSAPSLREARAEIPDALEAVYQRMVARQPDDRFPSMTEVITALETCRGPGRALVDLRQIEGRDMDRVAVDVTSFAEPPAQGTTISLSKSKRAKAGGQDHQPSTAEHDSVIL